MKSKIIKIQNFFNITNISFVFRSLANVKSFGKASEKRKGTCYFKEIMCFILKGTLIQI